jgi:HEAT repeats
MSPAVGDRRETATAFFSRPLTPVPGRISTVHARTWPVLLLFLLPCTGCGKKSTSELIQDVKSSEPGKPIVAVRLLAQRKGDAAHVVPALIEALNNNSNDVRLSAAIGLGHFGAKAKEAIPALETAEHDRDARVREAACIALCRIDPEKFPPETTAKAAREAIDARPTKRKK